MTFPYANILVTCTKRKRAVAPARLRLGTVGRGSPTDVARRWTERLEHTPSKKVPAASLYAGDHWLISSSLPHVALVAGVSARLWVLSAGYGLIQASDMVAPYSATFSAGHPDEVFARFEGKGDKSLVREWWAALAAWQGPGQSSPRSLASLAETYPDCPMVVVASPTYLFAAQDDLLDARERLEDPALLIVVSAGSRGKGPLAANMIECSARFQQTVGGALMSLNTRIARALIETKPAYPWTVTRFRERMKSFAVADGGTDKPSRSAVTDDDVRQYVRDALRENPASRRTTLLRLYREAGHACEQKRFGRLFKEVEQSYG